MTNKKIWLGILAAVLVFSALVVSCDDAIESFYEFTFVNQSSAVVSVSSYDLDPSSFSVSVGSSRTVRASRELVEFDWSPDTVQATNPSAGRIIFTD